MNNKRDWMQLHLHLVDATPLEVTIYTMMNENIKFNIRQCNIKRNQLKLYVKENMFLHVQMSNDD